MKTIKISKEIHNILKDYCKENNLKLGHWIEFILKEYTKNNINYDKGKNIKN